ncbi:MAG: RIP metalloprotease RseP [Bacteroidota bacterium]|nr:RIP metalloprotease RseP [Bacteroidota bacterium]
MDILIKALQLLLSLSILVVFHEFGHFAAAKFFKTRVEKFYLFFNPWFSLFKFKKGETEYGVGWLPLGGYVKISGMMDESMDKEQMAKPPEPYEFRSKPAWQRLIIMLGGVTVNIILAVAIYVMMLTVWGEEYLPTSEVKYGITVDSLAYDMGLRDGDKIVSIDNKAVADFAKIPSKIILDEAKTIQLDREGRAVEVAVPEGFIAKMLDNDNVASFISIRFPYEAGKFSKGSAAEAGGIKEGDKFIALNNSPLMYFDQYIKEIPKYKNSEVDITLLRGADTLNYSLFVPESGKIGVYPASLNNYFSLEKKTFSFLEAIPAGTVKAYKGVGSYLKQLKLLFSPEVKAYKSVGGFMSIGSIFPSIWDWRVFWSLTAFLSIMLAIINVLPIPALDGGHVAFLLYEMVTGKPASEKVLEYAQVVGMIILFSLLILANGNDILKYFF